MKDVFKANGLPLNLKWLVQDHFEGGSFLFCPSFHGEVEFLCLCEQNEKIDWFCLCWQFTKTSLLSWEFNDIKYISTLKLAD